MVILTTVLSTDFTLHPQLQARPVQGVSNSTADKLTETVVKQITRDCRLINTVEVKGFVEIWKTTFAAYDKRSSTYTGMT